MKFNRVVYRFDNHLVPLHLKFTTTRVYYILDNIQAHEQIQMSMNFLYPYGSMAM